MTFRGAVARGFLKVAAQGLLALVALPFLAQTPGVPPAAETRWTPGVYKLGEAIPLEVLLPIETSDFFLTGLPTTGTEWGTQGRVRSVSQEKPGVLPGLLVLKLQVQLFAVGEVALPTILVSVNTGAGAKTYAVSPPAVKIQATLAPGAAAPPPAQVLPFPAPGPWGLLIGGLVLLAVLCAVGFWFLKKARLGPTLPPAPKEADPDTWIRREVERLLAGGVDPAFRYGALSRSLREYLAIKTGLPFPDWTTAEIRRGMDPVGRLAGDPGQGLVQILVLCDQVKFARHLPSPEEEAQVRPRVALLLEALSRPEPAPAGEAA